MKINSLIPCWKSMAAELDTKWNNSDWLMKLMVVLTQINMNVCQENENWLTSPRTVPALSSSGSGKYNDKIYCQYLIGETRCLCQVILKM